MLYYIEHGKYVLIINQFDVEVNKIRDKVSKLCYPKFIVDKYFKNFVEKKIVVTVDETTKNKREEIVIRLPYIGEIIKRLVKQLNKTVQDRNQRNSLGSF